ncbi:MAG: hypothetical protein RLZZ217_2159 [Planctomycetota bacterium]
MPSDCSDDRTNSWAPSSRATNAAGRSASQGCLLPADGVYAATAHLDDGRAFIAAVSIGIKPTFTGARRTVEAHLLGFDGAIGDYGWSLRLALRRWVRDQVRFTSVDDLVRQIGIDTARCREELHA